MGVTPEPRPSTPTGRRTQALRGPGAGGFTPAQSLAASNPCLNCGTNIQLTYCPECGQREIDSDPTLREFLQELAEEFLRWDGKLVSTFRTLLTKPGLLTEEYLAGKRVRYISPMRLYLTCSIAYFFCAALVPNSVVRSVSGKQGATTRVGAINVGVTDTTVSLAQLDSLERAATNTAARWNYRLARAARDVPGVSRRIGAAIPNLVFVLLPLFAGFFALAFRDRRRRYPQHLVFALHVHAVLYLALIALLLGRLTDAIPIKLVLQLLVGAVMGVYMLFAAHRVYGGPRSGVLIRLVGVFGAYFLVFLTTMLATAAIIVWGM